MTPKILAHLLRYTDDGEFCDDSVTIEGQMVVDERYGVVLEIPLPPLVDHEGEGELVGGCDIVMDLHRSGELLRMLGRVDAVLAEKRVVAPTPANRAGARS